MESQTIISNTSALSSFMNDKISLNFKINWVLTQLILKFKEIIVILKDLGLQVNSNIFVLLEGVWSDLFSRIVFYFIFSLIVQTVWFRILSETAPKYVKLCPIEDCANFGCSNHTSVAISPCFVHNIKMKHTWSIKFLIKFYYITRKMRNFFWYQTLNSLVGYKIISEFNTKSCF